jgi:hypothetical protein
VIGPMLGKVLVPTTQPIMEEGWVMTSMTYNQLVQWSATVVNSAGVC